MTIYIDGHTYHYEMENLVRLFYPNEKLTVIQEPAAEPAAPCILTSMHRQQDQARLDVKVNIGEFSASDEVFVPTADADFEKTAERAMAVCLYTLLCRCTGKTQPWGILTGVRPIKLFRRLSEQYGADAAKDYFIRELKVSPSKTLLSARTEQYEKQILALSTNRSFSLYVSIPFCPTRCSYCSFVSQTVERAKKLVQPYLELLCKELVCTAAIVQEKGLRLESVYIGGGTPTTLDAAQLARLIDVIQTSFDMSTCREFTIEAGRPDTIDEPKLQAILNGGADRISINPQTLNDDVLRVIGRRHSAQETLDAFALARKVGFRHINMDLIAGLPTETAESFRHTLDHICRLNPESITVHLYAGGTEIKTAKLTAQNGWKRKFGDLPKFVDGHPIKYSITEDPVECYVTEIHGFTITNRYVPELMSVSVRKVWNDEDNRQQKRPLSIWMKLSNGMSVILNEANGWSATITGLPARVNGKPAVYTWTEQSVAGYELESKVTEGSTTVFTNRLWTRPDEPEAGRTPKTPGDTWYVFEEYDTPLGVEVIINHVGDCFD